MRARGGDSGCCGRFAEVWLAGEACPVGCCGVSAGSAADVVGHGELGGESGGLAAGDRGAVEVSELISPSP